MGVNSLKVLTLLPRGSYKPPALAVGSTDTLKGCEINLSEVFYDTVEVEEDSSGGSEIRNKIIQALKVSGVNMSDEQIGKAVKILESGEEKLNSRY